MMKVLTILENNINNADNNEPLSFEKAMASSHWPKWFKAILSELNSYKENRTWDLIDASSDCKVLTEWWVFKLKKDCLGNILKYKTQ